MGIEGYLGRIDASFGLFATVVFAGAAVASAYRLSTRRLVVLLGVAGSAGLCTQGVGTGIGAWSYPADIGTYAFVFFAFGVGSVFTYGAVELLAPWLPGDGRATTAVARVVVLGLVAFGIHDIRGTSIDTTPWLVVYYGVLVTWAVVMTTVARGQTVVALVVVGALYGAVAETLGARSGLWAFPSPWPPAWLMLVSWPLEVMFHYGVSAVATREAVDPA